MNCIIAALMLVVALSSCVGNYSEIHKPSTITEERSGETSGKKESEVQEQMTYERRNLTFIKMVSSENGMYSFDDKEIAELKSLNINCIRICPLYEPMPDGSFRLIESEEFYRDLIRKAHSSGWAVFLEPNAIGGPGFQTLDSRYLDDLLDIAAYWAKIAEEENVEFYSPLNEPDIVLGYNLINEWIEKSKEARHLFSGDLVIKFADVGPEGIDISGYDYVAFDILWGDANYDELREHLNFAVERGESLKEKYNLKGFIFGELGAEKSMVDEETQTEIFETVLDETWGRVDGYCFLGWSDLEFSFRDNEGAKEVIKKWYSRDWHELKES